MPTSATSGLNPQGPSQARRDTSTPRVTSSPPSWSATCLTIELGSPDWTPAPPISVVCRPPMPIGRDVARVRLLHKLEILAIELGIAAHETIHQLVANSGLSPRPDSLPTWVSRGAGDAIRGRPWGPVGRCQPRPRLAPPRLPRDRPSPTTCAPGTLTPGFGHGYRRDVYAQSWALVYFLRKQHPHELTVYLDLLRSPPPAARDHSLHYLNFFRTSFAQDLSTFESEWHRFLRPIRTPLESNFQPTNPTRKANRPRLTDTPNLLPYRSQTHGA